MVQAGAKLSLGLATILMLGATEIQAENLIQNGNWKLGIEKLENLLLMLNTR